MNKKILYISVYLSIILFLGLTIIFLISTNSVKDCPEINCKQIESLNSDKPFCYSEPPVLHKAPVYVKNLSSGEEWIE